MIENIIHEFVRELAEEAQRQIQTDVNDIKTVDFPCTEDDYVKLAVEATLMEDPVKALCTVLEAHAWVMTREMVKVEGRHIVEDLIRFAEENTPWDDLVINRNTWDDAESQVKESQNKKLVEMIIGDSNGS